MSLRRAVDRSRIELFLRHLGERYRQPARLFFDLYSTALSKVERGRRQDLTDVILLLQHRRVAWDRLEAMFDEILPQMGVASLRQDPDEFAANFQALSGLWRMAGGTP